MISALVFLAAFLTDVCWARYVCAASDRSRWVCSSWAVGIYTCNALAVVEYTQNHWMLVPAIAGSFVGTAFGVPSKASP